MKILVAGLKKNPQLKRLQEAGERRGHLVKGVYSSELSIYADRDSFLPVVGDERLADYDLVYLWAVSKRRWEWFTAARYLSQEKGVIVVNQKVLNWNDYLLSPTIDYLIQYQGKLPFPQSAVFFSVKSLKKIITRFRFPLILKTTTGRQGRGIFKVDQKADLIKLIKKLREKGVGQALVLREFVPNDGDLRVFTVGYRAIGAMHRQPAPGEFRSNISQGGTGRPFALEKYPEIKELAEKASQITKTEIAGVDIIIHSQTKKPYLLEVNPGPQFTGLEKYTKTNAALAIIQYFESLRDKQ